MYLVNVIKSKNTCVHTEPGQEFVLIVTQFVRSTCAPLGSTCALVRSTCAPLGPTCVPLGST